MISNGKRSTEWWLESKHLLVCVISSFSHWATQGSDAASAQDDRLWVSDPKAIHHILQASRYDFVKPYAARFALNAATGPGVNGADGNQTLLLYLTDLWVTTSIGEDHYRQRRILLPAFGPSESR